MSFKSSGFVHVHDCSCIAGLSAWCIKISLLSILRKTFRLRESSTLWLPANSVAHI